MRQYILIDIPVQVHVVSALGNHELHTSAVARRRACIFIAQNSALLCLCSLWSTCGIFGAIFKYFHRYFLWYFQANQDTVSNHLNAATVQFRRSTMINSRQSATNIRISSYAVCPTPPKVSSKEEFPNLDICRLQS